MSDIDICTGLIYRGNANYYINDNGEYIYQEKMTKLKRKSCPGCPKCWGSMDELIEYVQHDKQPIISHIVDKALYRLEVVNISRDWESSIIKIEEK